MSAPSLVLLALALAADPAPKASGPAPAIHALVERCVDAYGGKKAIVRLARIREEGSVTSNVLHPGAAGRISRVYQRSGKLRVEIAYPDAPREVRVLDGSRGWRFGEEVQGPFLVSMILQAARLDLPSLLAAWEAKLVDEGTAEVDGKTLRVLALEVAPGLRIEAAIDAATGRILRSRGTGTGGMPLEFVTTYSDFRTVDGVLVAFREGNYANGRTTGDTVLEKVEFPASLPEATFRP
ncbi:hypothetical protein [Anaeromyxobacter oryzae]|uniref:Outer membrane lipoprotein-sorting protein n=1 Tax=Anaeromyxobacter oryzae TaxID=2918170 RepID=A0ABM7WZG2_9BACT|nr:hypothetical protein [Anaeromyxobacter oryzae]BDG04841.1 hypothetical protein AMOR_38370 [Anaeromyxobacter oryzae]